MSPQRRSPRSFSRLALAFCLLLGLPGVLRADDITWTNAAGGNWNVASNWNSGAGPVPGPLDRALITTAGTYTVTLNVDATVAGLVLGAVSGVQTLSVPATRVLTLDGASTVNATGVLTLTSATVSGSGSLTNQGLINFTATTINVPLVNQGTVVVRGPCSQNGALTAAAGSVLRVEGTASQAAATLTVANGFTNEGTIELTDTAVFTATLNVTNGVLVNAPGRAINVLLGNNGPRTLGAALDNHGTLTLNRALTISKAGADHVNQSDGTVNLAGGDLSVSQSGTTPSFTNQGTITVVGGRTMTVSGGTFTHAGGMLSGAGAMTLNSATASFDVAQGLGAITLNVATASFATDQSATAFTLISSTFNGPGTLTNPVGRTTNVTASTINSALINQGTVVFRGPCTQNGALTAAAGSVLRVEGTASNAAGTLTVANGFTNEGTIELTDTAVFSATLNVTAGVLVNAPGRAINVLLGNNGPRTLGAVLDNHGTLTLNRALTINKGSADHINQNDGTVNLAGGDLSVSQSGTTPSFTNQGTITVAGGRTLTVSGGTFTHAGGTLSGAGAMTLNSATASFDAQGLGAITLNVATASFATDQNATAFTLISSTFNGPGTLTNPLGRTTNVTASTINPALINQGSVVFRGPCNQNGPLTAAVGSVLRVEGTASQAAATLTVANGFTNEGTIELTDTAVFSATLNVTAGVLVNAPGRAINVLLGNNGPRTLGAVLENHGTLTLSRALTINKASADHVNPADGTVDLAGGDLSVSQSGTTPSFVNQGTIAVAGGRTMSVSGGTFTHAGGTLSGAGAMSLTSATASFQVAQELGAMTLNGTTASFATDQSATAFTLINSTFNGPGTLTNPAGRTTNVTASTINTALINQGTVVFRGQCDQNGALTAAPGSLLRIEGTGAQAAAGLDVANGFTNEGTIELTDTAVFAATLNVTAGVLVNAPGRAINVLLGNNGPRTLGAVLENHGTLTLSRALTISKASADHVNHADGTMNLAGGDLSVSHSGTTPSFTNQGTITVAGGRTMSVSGGTFAHSGGTLSGAGGMSLTSVNASFDVAQGLATMSLNASTASFALDQGATHFTLNNSTFNGPGTLTNPAGRTTNVTQSTINTALINQGSVVFRGQCDQNGALTAAAGSVLRIEGTGAQAAAGLDVANGFTNEGTIELTDTAVFAATLNVTTGVLVNAAGRAINVLLGNNGPRTLGAVLENHGTLTLSRALTISKGGADHINHADGTMNLTGGDLAVSQSGTTPSFTNHGTITVAGGRTMSVSGGTLAHSGGTLSGAGGMSLTSVNASFDVAQGLATMSLNASTASFALDQGATHFTLNNSTFNGPGTLTNPAGRTTNVTQSTINTALINQGSVVFRGQCDQNGALTAAAGSVLRIEGTGAQAAAGLDVASGFTNEGTIELTDTAVFAATLNVINGVLVNAAACSIKVLLATNGPRTLGAVLDNHGALMLGRPLTVAKASADHVNQSDGTIDVTGGNLTVSQSGTTPSFTNLGTATIAAGRVWAVTAGSFENGATGTLAGSGTLNLTGATFTRNAGTISPGASAGTLSITGSYPEDSSAVVNLEIGGLTAGTQHDRLAISGIATLVGTLNLSLIDGFTPVAGDQFRVVTAGARNGRFRITGGELGGGIALEPHYDATGLTLVAVGQTWSRLLTVGGPPPSRDGHGAVYDPAGNRMTVFGGRADAGWLDDAWALTNANGFGGAPAWSLLAASGSPPAARAGHTAVYDPASNRLIVHGGDDSVTTFGDVRVLTNANGVGGSPVWSLLTTTGGPPAARTRHSAVYDPASNRMVLFGGIPSAVSCAGMNDVWVLTAANGLGGTPTWSQLTPTGGPPAARWSHNAAYDAANNRMIVFGGDLTCAASDNQVWVLSNANGLGGTPSWTQLAPGGTPPAPWSLHSGVYDPGLDRLTAFGGDVNDTLTDAVWTLTQANGLGGAGSWLNLTPSQNRPSARSLHSAVQDATNHRMVMFAGRSAAGRLNDVWVLEHAAGRVLDVPPPPETPSVASGPTFTGFSHAPAPNPSRGAVRFAIAASHAQAIDVTVYDIAGRRVAEVYRGAMEPGERTYAWDGLTRAGAPAGAGLYLVRLEADGVTQTRRFCLVR